MAEEKALEEKIAGLCRQIEVLDGMVEKLSKNLPAVVSPPQTALALPSLQDIKNHLCPGISDTDAFIFLQTAKAHGLNPFKGEIYIVPFKDGEGKRRYSAIIDYHVFLSRAKLNPGYLYFEVGLLYSQDKKVNGAWCKIYDEKFGVNEKGERKFFYHEIDLDEYDKHQALWNTKKNTMLKKTAIRQAHNLCYPELAGLPPTRDEILDANGMVVDANGKAPKTSGGFRPPPIDGGFFGDEKPDQSLTETEKENQQNGEKVNKSEVGDLVTLLHDAKIEQKDALKYCKETFEKTSFGVLTKSEYKQVLEWIKDNAKE